MKSQRQEQQNETKLPRQPKFQMECRYNDEEWHCYTFRSIWDYLVHLQKCHIINAKVQKGLIASFYICHQCLYIFETEEAAKEHKSKSHSFGFERIFQNFNERIQLSKKGMWEIKRLIDNYKDTYLNPSNLLEPTPAIIIKPLLTDPRLHTPKDLATKISHMSIERKEKLKLNLTQSFVIESAFYKLYNHYKDLQLINKDFPQKMTEATFYQLMAKNNIVLSPELYNQTRVCEFMEQNLSKQEDHAIYMNKRTINKYSYLWLLIHEDVNPFRDVQFQEPWAILAIPTSKDQLQAPQQEKTKYTEELQELKKLMDAEMEVNKKNELEMQKLNQLKAEEMKQIQQRDKKLEQLETHLSITLTSLAKQQNEFEALQEQYSIISQQKLSKAQSDLEGYYDVQKERIQNDVTNQSGQYKQIENMVKKKERMKQRIDMYYEKRDKFHYETQRLKTAFCDLQDKLNEQQNKRIPGKQQIIILHLCIKCKERTRQVIHFPCQHFLFCQKCYIENLVEKKQYCPLINIRQCTDQRNLKRKTKTVIFSDFPKKTE